MQLLLAFIMAAGDLSFPPTDGERPANVFLDETDAKLFAFCRTAILQDRGLTCTLFIGSTDDWIVKRLLPDPSFLKALDASADTSLFERFEPEGARSTRRSIRNTDIAGLYQSRGEATQALAESLTKVQRSRLPGVYLRTEGLMALCRSEFAGLFEDANTPQQIRKLVEDRFSTKAAMLHQGIFTLRTLDELPTLHSELRLVSMELDLQIMQLLTTTERQRLVDLIRRSRSLDAVVVGGPPM
jgi:hypothetical protein